MILALACISPYATAMPCTGAVGDCRCGELAGAAVQISVKGLDRHAGIPGSGSV